MSQKASANAKKGFAMTTMVGILARYENPSQAVNTLLDNEAQGIIENENVIESICVVREVYLFMAIVMME